MHLSFTFPTGQSLQSGDSNSKEGKKRSSKEVYFKNNKIKTPLLKTDNAYKIIYFEVNNKKVATKYEIYDAYGNILKKGLNSEVDLSNLTKGIYYVNFDNKNEKIMKK